VCNTFWFRNGKSSSSSSIYIDIDILLIPKFQRFQLFEGGPAFGASSLLSLNLIWTWWALHWPMGSNDLRFAKNSLCKFPPL
jgi:hypothetical protein